MASSPPTQRNSKSNFVGFDLVYRPSKIVYSGTIEIRDSGSLIGRVNYQTLDERTVYEPWNIRTISRIPKKEMGDFLEEIAGELPRKNYYLELTGLIDLRDPYQQTL